MYELFGSKCSCHGEPRQIVQSREGGQISQNCVISGQPFKIGLNQLPDWECPKCKQICDKKQDHYSTYIYICNNCNKTDKVADLVPHWSELFGECPFDAQRDEKNDDYFIK